MKESFFKAAFVEVGQYFYLKCVSIMQVNQNKKIILMRVNEWLSKSLTAGTELETEYKILPESKI